MFPMTITLTSTAQLSAVLAALSPTAIIEKAEAVQVEAVKEEPAKKLAPTRTVAEAVVATPEPVTASPSEVVIEYSVQ